MSKATKTKQVGQTSSILTEEVKLVEVPIEPEVVKNEEQTREQKIINYIAGSRTENVDLVPLIKSLYPLATYSEPAAYQQQGEAKRLRVMLEKMVVDGQIIMYDEGYKKLGRHYYEDGDTKTKFYTIDSVKVTAVK